jgi:hypothetical protein
LAPGIVKSAQQALAWFKASVQKLSGTSIEKVLIDQSVVTQEETIEAAVKAGLFKTMDHTNIGQM